MNLIKFLKFISKFGYLPTLQAISTRIYSKFKTGTKKKHSNRNQNTEIFKAASGVRRAEQFAMMRAKKHF